MFFPFDKPDQSSKKKNAKQKKKQTNKNPKPGFVVMSFLLPLEHFFFLNLGSDTTEVYYFASKNLPWLCQIYFVSYKYVSSLPKKRKNYCPKVFLANHYH